MWIQTLSQTLQKASRWSYGMSFQSILYINSLLSVMLLLSYFIIHTTYIQPKHMGHGEVDIVNTTTTVPAPIHNYESLLRHAMQLCDSLGVKPDDIRSFGLSLRDLKPRVSVSN